MIQVFPDFEALSTAAAELFIYLAAQVLAVGERFNVALSGGSTPKRTYELLGEPTFSSRIPWEKVHVFWGDERCVPPDDPRNNFLMARRAFLDKVPIPPSQVHPIQCAASPDRAAHDYEKMLSDFFDGESPRFDLVFLGLGEDGHTASLFPGSSAIGDVGRWASAVHVRGQDISRVTLTPLILNQASRKVFIVSGEKKARALREVLSGPYDPDRLPAQAIQDEDDSSLIWLVDKAAASLL